MQPSLSFYLAAGVSITLIGLSKGGVGGMLGPLVTATMAMVLPANVAVGLLLPLLIVGDAFAVAAHWGRWSRYHVVRLVPASALGVLLAVGILTSVSPLLLRRGLALLILAFLGYRSVSSRFRRSAAYEHQGWHGPAAGAVAGFTSGLAHVGGPPISIYLLLQNLSPSTYAATSALFFAALNLIKLPLYGLSGLIQLPVLIRTLWLLPLMPLGVWAGRWFTRRVAQETFERVIMGLLLMSAVFLLLET